MKGVTQPSFRDLTQGLYTLRYRSSFLAMWKSGVQAGTKPAGWPSFAILGAFSTLLLTPILTFTRLIPFHWITVLLTFVAATAAVLFVVSLVVLLQARSRLTIVKIGAEGCSIQFGGWSQACPWRDVKYVVEREGTIVVGCKDGIDVKVPRQTFADAAARLKFLNDLRRWHGLANAANTEHV